MSNGIEATTALLIEPLAPVRRDDCLHCAARICFPDGREDTLWFEVAPDTPVTSLADPFLVAMLFEGMARNVPVRVKGSVSAGLLYRLEEFMAVWAQFVPARYHRVALEVDQVVADPPPARAALSTFSGGADSCFTAFRHAQGDPRYPRIDAGLMVHGLDIPLDDPAFASAMASSAQMLASLDMSLVWVRTNIRSVNRQRWGYIFATALAACGHLLSPAFGRLYIPSSFALSAGELVNGSNPLSDPMLASEALQIVHDGATHTRAVKLRTISEWPAAMQGLRVCWEGAQRDANCCRCEKCIRNMLNFQLEGLPVPPAFPLPLTPEAIRSLKLGPTEVIIWKLLNRSARGDERLPAPIRAAISDVTRRMSWRNATKRWSRRLRGRHV
ncbi:hypothetical protein [Isoalcanivorax indicus]|uniref:hypothetical protein n=1 Tax=Isoalcanivorax indicus TaxID=2202653 RepID=UPI0013C46B06|nr:hypothetical protein [Isoalcanivorax indicus]